MINNYKEFKEFLNNLESKPKLLLHACCGPCSTYTIDFLNKYFDITIYYDNSNIDTLDEFNKRLEELTKIVNELNTRKEKNIQIIIFDYNYDEFMKDLTPFANQKEGGERCHICYKKRMLEAMIYADQNDFDFFTTSLTSSRQKSAFIINKIGEEIAKNAAKVKYFYSDFKKKAWAEIGYATARERGYYLQEYCGCEYSLNEQTID